MRESEIIYESGVAWVHAAKDAYVVYVTGITHSNSDSAYAKDADGLSIAIARAKYLGRQYFVVAINSKSGKRHPLSRPMSHQQACTMKSKFTRHEGRHIEIEQV